jgi:hypothetical protein
MYQKLITYKYKEKEISTPTSEGHTTDFRRTKDWIEWLQKGFEINKDEWKEKQWEIQFKSQNQPKYINLFWTDKEATENGWTMDEDEKTEGMIYFPPIYLHPLVEDYLFSHCKDCGNKTKYNVRQMKESLKGKSSVMSWCMVSCKGCGKIGKIDKECIYRVCKNHMGEGRHFWIDAWKKLGIGERL